MTSQPLELEGTWEEIVTHSAELTGHKVRVIIVPDESESSLLPTPPFRPASGRSLLRHAGTWEGDDFEECLRLVYESRSQLEF
ncbi:hypothetical protein [Nostoc sp. WHI]|uniref:hypothetical protein n=1 Tax=Nostoc sp. WHI TaxID=2650611 RepID=UPI0018C50C3B|nr:hypothetical protein [Nostoc sp. WHI]MBG1269597.1 hypothetical protein [Nostoc sp. WHI]